MPEKPESTEALIDRIVERSVQHAVFGDRRDFLKVVGAGTAAAALAEVFPMGAAKALAQAKLGPPEKKDLKIGFIPITCATPIIMAEPMGFYKKYGLNAQVVKASSWAMIRDLSINKESDATHMLSPMPLSISMGIGSQEVPYVMPAVENINGQAITLANKHKGVKSAAEFKGFKFGVPFDYSMHNFLLRYVVAEGGLDPDKDIQIRSVPPPEMVANLRAGNLDGYLGPDPFNQRAVYENEGFIFMLSKDIWPGHPCCAFAARKDFAESAPEHVRRAVPGDRGRDGVRPRQEEPQGDLRRHRPAQLSQPAGRGRRGGADGAVRQRSRPEDERAGPGGLRSRSRTSRWRCGS